MLTPVKLVILNTRHNKLIVFAIRIFYRTFVNPNFNYFKLNSTYKMEKQVEKINKTKRGRKAMPPEKKKRLVGVSFAPDYHDRLSKDVEKGLANKLSQRVEQIVEKFYNDEQKRKPPW